MAAPIRANIDTSINQQSLNRASKQIQQALGRISGNASEFQKSLDASTARVFAFGATTAVLNGVNQSFKALVSTTIQVEAQLAKVSSILGGTAIEMRNLRNEIFQVAKNTGQAFDTVATAAAELARQGLGAAETARRLEAALILTRVSGLSAENSVKALTAAINGYSAAALNAEEITNKLVAVETSFAVSAADLANGIGRAGAVAQDAGVSFDELLGLITAVEQRTARGGAVIGNAFKSIFTRLSRGDTIKQLQELGIAIDSSQSGVEKLRALAEGLERISDPTVASKIKELAGGVFQINVVSAALDDVSKKSGIFASAAEKSANASDEALRKNAELNAILSAQINELVIGLTSIGERIGNLTLAPVISQLASFATKVTETLDKIFDPEKGNVFVQGLFSAIGKFLGGPALVLFAIAFAKIFGLVAKFAKEGLTTIFNIGSELEKQNQIQSGIVDLLSRDENLRKQITSESLTLTQKQELIIKAIKKENALLENQKKILKDITQLATAKGVSGYSPQTGFSMKGGGKAGLASGFMQEEAEARMLGATSSVKAHFGKGTIGGKRFIMNNQEVEIPNFGRNGDSAVIPRYSLGHMPRYATGNLLDDFEDRKTRSPSNPIIAKISSLEADLGDEAAKINVKKTVGQDLPTMLTPTEKGPVSTFQRSSKIINPKGYTVEYDFLNAFAPDTSKVPNLAERLKPFSEEAIVEEANQRIIPLAQEFLNVLNGYTDPKSKPTKEITPNDVKQLDNIKGFVGAVKGAYGGIFDAAMTLGFGLQAKKNNQQVGGDFDIRGAPEKTAGAIKFLFGEQSIPASGLAEYKISASAGNKSSLADKTAKEYKSEIQAEIDRRYKAANDEYQKELKRQKEVAAGGSAATNRKASGFIPNFNAINEGVPMSKIRAHFDGAGNPIAITNTRDEPNGLKDAIQRERRGIGMNAKGFVPNYAKGGKSSGGSDLLGSVVALQIGIGAVSTLFSTFAASGRKKTEQQVAVIQQSIDAEKERLTTIKENGDKEIEQSKKELQERVEQVKENKQLTKEESEQKISSLREQNKLAIDKINERVDAEVEAIQSGIEARSEEADLIRSGSSSFQEWNDGIASASTTLLTLSLFLPKLKSLKKQLSGLSKLKILKQIVKFKKATTFLGKSLLTFGKGLGFALKAVATFPAVIAGTKIALAAAVGGAIGYGIYKTVLEPSQFEKDVESDRITEAANRRADNKLRDSGEAKRIFERKLERGETRAEQIVGIPEGELKAFLQANPEDPLAVQVESLKKSVQSSILAFQKGEIGFSQLARTAGLYDSALEEAAQAIRSGPLQEKGTWETGEQKTERVYIESLNAFIEQVNLTRQALARQVKKFEEIQFKESIEDKLKTLDFTLKKDESDNLEVKRISEAAKTINSGRKEIERAFTSASAADSNVAKLTENILSQIDLERLIDREEFGVGGVSSKLYEASGFRDLNKDPDSLSARDPKQRARDIRDAIEKGIKTQDPRILKEIEELVRISQTREEIKDDEGKVTQEGKEFDPKDLRKEIQEAGKAFKSSVFDSAVNIANVQTTFLNEIGKLFEQQDKLKEERVKLDKDLKALVTETLVEAAKSFAQIIEDANFDGLAFLDNLREVQNTSDPVEKAQKLADLQPDLQRAESKYGKEGLQAILGRAGITQQDLNKARIESAALTSGGDQLESQIRKMLGSAGGRINSDLIKRASQGEAQALDELDRTIQEIGLLSKENEDTLRDLILVTKLAAENQRNQVEAEKEAREQINDALKKNTEAQEEVANDMQNLSEAAKAAEESLKKFGENFKTDGENNPAEIIKNIRLTSQIVLEKFTTIEGTAEALKGLSDSVNTKLQILTERVAKIE